jgi:SagB-type dehydrogenase family enzyme
MPTKRPEDQLKRMLEQTLIPPTTVVELDPDSVDATTSRIADTNGSLSEMYQLNSQHTPATLQRLPDAASRRTIRTFYFETTMKSFEKQHGQGNGRTMQASSLPSRIASLLSPLWMDPAVVDSLYSVDVLVLIDGAVWRSVPGTTGFLREKQWTEEQQALLQHALPQSKLDGKGVVLLVGHLARTAYLAGDRAARSIGVMTGIVSGALHRAGSAASMDLEIVDGFIDAHINRAAGCDGVERSVTAVLLLSPRSEPSSADDRGVESSSADNGGEIGNETQEPASGLGEPGAESGGHAATETSSLEPETTIVAERWQSLSTAARAAVLETIDAAADVDGGTQKASLGRIVHRVFERSVQEFFTSERQSTQLPPELIRHCLPHPAGIPLPDVEADSDVSLTDVLAGRRSVRSFEQGSLTSEDLSRILRPAAGVTDWEDGYGIRGIPKLPYPSIGGLDSNELGVLAFNIEGIEPGYYIYDKVAHALVPKLRGDMRLSLVSATFESEWLFYAPVVFVLANDQEKVAWKYKTRGYRISHLDQGALMQNLALTATAHGFGACPVAGYFDEVLARTLGYEGTDTFIASLVAVGRPTRLGHGG